MSEPIRQMVDMDWEPLIEDAKNGVVTAETLQSVNATLTTFSETLKAWYAEVIPVIVEMYRVVYPDRWRRKQLHAARERARLSTQGPRHVRERRWRERLLSERYGK